MRPEELFQAIGAVEESRLARSELSMSSPKQEDKKMKPTKIIRYFLAAAVIVSMLAVTAYAVGSYLIFDTPEAMLSAIFGDHTGFDHGEYTEVTDPERPGSLLAAYPEYDRVEADPTVVAEDMAPHVSPVGQSIAFHDMVLTVDTFMYDSATGCGVVTYTLENGPAYNLQTTGEIWYEGRPDPADFSQYGYPYIIQEKTTVGKLAAAYYFRYDPRWDEGFSVGLRQERSYEERMQERRDFMEEVKAQYTPEEAAAAAAEKLLQAQQDNPDVQFAAPGDWLKEGDTAYEILRDLLIVERAPGDTESEERISFDCTEDQEMKHLTLAAGDIILDSMSMVVDITQMDFLHTDTNGLHRVSTDNMDELIIRFADGTEYLVFGGDTDNTVFGLSSQAEGSNDAPYSILTLMFNRVIDIDAVSAVVINGHEFPMI